MSAALPPARPHPAAPRVLVVDDDRRVRELLEIALSSHGFGVLTAADGDEAILRAQSERPDLVLLDVRLPKRSGLEVCDALRNDPADPTVPIVMISAAAEADQRLHAFTRGADDYLAKPFSPKELVARLRRLLARAMESRIALRRMQEMERELASARRQAQRAGLDARREQAFRDVVDGPARELVRTLDLEDLAAGLLHSVRARLGDATAGLLLAAGRPARLVPWAVAGDRFERLAGLELPAAGEVATLLAGLRRPVLVEELERLCERPGAVGPFVAGRWRLLAPLVGRDGIEGVVLVEERPDGAPFLRDDAGALAALCEMAALAAGNARRVLAQNRELIAGAADRSYRGEAATSALAEARALLERCAPGLGLPPGEAEAVHHALAFVDAGDTPLEEARRALAALAAGEACGLARRALALLDPVAPQRGAGAEARAALMLGLRAYLRARVRGAGPEAALAKAAAAVPPALATALVATAQG